MSTSPQVTIGLPVHNGARHLHGALTSILEQDVEALEVVISDNGSTDETPDICRAVASADPRVRYVRSPQNRGAAWNYNRLVGLARGQFFKWASDDDELEPTYLRRCLEAFSEGSPETVLCYPRTVLVDGEGRTIEAYDDRMDARQADPVERLRHVLVHLRLCNAVFGLTRLDVLRTTRLIGAYHSSDVVLLAELALRGEIHEVPEPLFRRRRSWSPDARHRLSVAEKTVWFDPARQVRRTFPRTRLITEHLRAISASPLSPVDRVRCARVLATEWGPRHWRTVGGEFRRALVLPRTGP